MAVHQRSDRRLRLGSGKFFAELTDQLVRSVRHKLFLDERDDVTKITRRDHWEAAGIEVEEPEVYAAGAHLVDWFWRIDQTRTAGGFGGLNPIGAVGIEAWARLTATEVEPWEGRALLDMDSARLAGPEEDVPTEAPASQAINPAMFDALFG